MLIQPNKVEKEISESVTPLHKNEAERAEKRR